MVTTKLRHLVTTTAIQGDTDLRLTHLVSPGTGINNMISLEYGLTRQGDNTALTILDLLPGAGIQLIKCQRGGGTNDLFSLFGIVNTRQFDTDGILPLTLYRGFGDPQLIDPLLQNTQVLHYPLIDEGVAFLLGECEGKLSITTGQTPCRRLPCGVTPQQALQGRYHLVIRHRDTQRSRLPFLDHHPTQLGLAKLLSQLLHHGADFTVDQKAGIDPNQQLGATAQIQTQFDRCPP